MQPVANSVARRPPAACPNVDGLTVQRRAYVGIATYSYIHVLVR
eukprot:COSAG01_NODE_28_length_36622_cov_14.695751_16_plen_44_part_00